MSRFLLCWRRDGGPLPPTFLRYADALPARDGVSAPRRVTHADRAAWHWPGAWAPGAEEALPLERDGWFGSGVLRLDDRPTLAARLRDAGVAGPDDDASLAWRSLVAWGERAPERWMGDYAVAAVAPHGERLVVARGIVGVRSCFHASADGTECVSDDLHLLATLLAAWGAPPERAVAEYLRLGQLATPTLTFFHGIARVPPAHTLVVARDGTRRLMRHWEFPAPRTRHGLAEGAVVEEFHETLGAAVADRLRGPAASLLLSGGLDSAALAVAMRRAAPGVRAHGLTVSWSRLMADDEVPYARLAAEATGVSHEVVEHAPDAGLPSGSTYATPEPAPDAEPRLWRAQAARLAEKAPVALLGEDVDALLMPPPLFAQLRQDGVRQTLRSWSAFRRATGERPWIGARRSVPLFERWRERSQERAPTWLRADVVARHPLPDVPTGAPHATRALAVRTLQRPTWAATCWLDDPGMSGADLVVLLPFMDPRVIRFFFSLPAVPWAQKKHLLRRALRVALPPALLARPKTALRGYYDARVRVWRERGVPAPVPAGVEAWVDLRAWHRTLRQSNDADAVFAAWRVLELARWLAQPRPVLR